MVGHLPLSHHLDRESKTLGLERGMGKSILLLATQPHDTTLLVPPCSRKKIYIPALWSCPPVVTCGYQNLKIGTHKPLTVPGV